MQAHVVLQTVERILAGAILLQSIEYLSLYRTMRDGAAWDWQLIRDEFTTLPFPLRRVLDGLCGMPGFAFVLGARLGCSLSLWIDPTPISLLVLLISSVLISCRWLGSFNGGSDSMTSMLLTVLLLARWGESGSWIQELAICYIAVQSVFSYFWAGWAKLRSSCWREGWAIGAFIDYSAYHVLIPKFASTFVANRSWQRFCAWLVLGFECSFPVALIDYRLAWIYITCALMFHIVIFSLFGLNRFILVWIATYPALLYVSIL